MVRYRSTNTQLSSFEIGRRVAQEAAQAALRTVSRWRRSNPNAFRAVALTGGSAGLTNIMGRAARFASRGARALSSVNNSDKPKQIYTQRGGGMTFVKGKKRKMKRGHKTLKKRIQALEKAKVPKSIYSDHHKQDILLQVAPNSRRTYFIKCDTIPLIEGTIDSVEYPSDAAKNLTTSNTSIAFQTFHKLYIACGSLKAVQIRVVRVVCKDHTPNTPIQALIDDAVDRKLTGFSISTEINATPTVSKLPAHVVQAEPVMGLKMLSTCYDRTGCEWKKVGSVETYKLNPGDQTSFSFARKFVYKPEVKDQYNQTYIAGYDSGFLIEIVGEMGHSSTKVGYCSSDCDVMLMSNFNAVVHNGLGLKDFTSTGGDYTAGSYSFVQAGSNNVMQ